MTARYQATDLTELFAHCFLSEFQTELVSGEGEPEYIPAHGHWPCNRVIFAHGYFASALHEVSHWCIAGPARRQQRDYGYWYCPDGRDAREQALFQQVEVKPQALEWLFSQAAGSSFHLSLDNLNGDSSAGYEDFRQAVWQQAQAYLTAGLPPRAARFQQALLDFYQRRSCFGPALFSLDSLT